MESKFTMKFKGDELVSEAEKIEKAQDEAIDKCIQPALDDISDKCYQANLKLQDVLFTMEMEDIMRTYFSSCYSFVKHYKKYIQDTLFKVIEKNNFNVKWHVTYDDDGPVRYEDKRTLIISKK